jgi:hypothetical protein
MMKFSHSNAAIPAVTSSTGLVPAIGAPRVKPPSFILTMVKSLFDAATFMQVPLIP